MGQALKTAKAKCAESREKTRAMENLELYRNIVT